MELGLGKNSVLITGASQGVGRATAHMLGSEGCELVLVARSQGDLDEVRNSIVSKHAAKVATIAIDITEKGSADRIVEAHPDIDILINNAGAIPAGAMDQVDEQTWRTAWDLKVFGYINLTRVYFARMKMRKAGVILNVMGSSADRPGPGTIAIGMANATLNAMTKALGGTSADFGVRILGINPGPIATERLVKIMRVQAETKLGDAERWRELTSSMPFGRAAEPEEIASVISFLVSPRASYVTGAILNVDGGTANKVTTY